MQDQLFKQEFINQPNVSRIAGFYGSNRTVDLEKPTTLTALSNPYSLVHERQKQLMQTYAKIYGKLPTQKILVSPETFPQAYQEVMNRSTPNSIYQDYRQLADALFNGGAFLRFPAANNVVAVQPQAINVAQAAAAQAAPVRNIMAAQAQAPVVPIQVVQQINQMGPPPIVPQNAQVNNALIMNGFIQAPMQQLQVNTTLTNNRYGNMSMGSSSAASQMFAKVGANQDMTKPQLSSMKDSEMEESKESVAQIFGKGLTWNSQQSVDNLVDPNKIVHRETKSQDDDPNILFQDTQEFKQRLIGIRERREDLRQDMIIFEATIQPKEQRIKDLRAKIDSKSYQDESEMKDMMREVVELDKSVRYQKKEYERTMDAFIGMNFEEAMHIDKGSRLNSDIMREAAAQSIGDEAMQHMAQPVQQIFQNAAQSMKSQQMMAQTQQSKVDSLANPLEDGDLTSRYNPTDTNEMGMSRAMSMMQQSNSISQPPLQHGLDLGNTPGGPTPGQSSSMIPMNTPGGMSQSRAQNLDVMMDAQQEMPTSNAPLTRQSQANLDMPMEEDKQAMGGEEQLAKPQRIRSGMNETETTQLDPINPDPDLQKMFDVPKKEYRGLVKPKSGIKPPTQYKGDLDYESSMGATQTTALKAPSTTARGFMGNLLLKSQGGKTNMSSTQTTQLAGVPNAIPLQAPNIVVPGATRQTQMLPLPMPGMSLGTLMKTNKSYQK